MGYFIFFLHTTDFLPLEPYPMHKKITKNPLNYYLLKVKKFHGESVKKKSARAKKLEGGAKRPPPSLFRVKMTIDFKVPFLLIVLNQC